MGKQDEINRIRAVAQILDRKTYGHKEILDLLEEVMRTFPEYLPGAKLEEKKKNTKWVGNFGLKDIPLVMVERPHGNRGDSVPQVWRKRQINAVDAVLDFIESQPEKGSL